MISYLLTSLNTPTPAPSVAEWASTSLGQSTAVASAASGAGLNWVFLGSVIVGIVTALFAFIGISQIASSRRGDVARAGRQSAVAAIGTFWVALAIGGFAALLISGIGTFLSSAFAS